MRTTSSPTRVSGIVRGTTAFALSAPSNAVGVYVIYHETVARAQAILDTGTAMVSDMSDAHKTILAIMLVGGCAMLNFARGRREAGSQPERARRFSAVEMSDTGGTIHPDDIRYAPLIPRDQWPDLSRVLPNERTSG